MRHKSISITILLLLILLIPILAILLTSRDEVGVSGKAVTTGDPTWKEINNQFGQRGANIYINNNKVTKVVQEGNSYNIYSVNSFNTVYKYSFSTETEKISEYNQKHQTTSINTYIEKVYDTAIYEYSPTPAAVPAASTSAGSSSSVNYISQDQWTSLFSKDTASLNDANSKILVMKEIDQTCQYPCKFTIDDSSYYYAFTVNNQGQTIFITELKSNPAVVEYYDNGWKKYSSTGPNALTSAAPAAPVQAAAPAAPAQAAAPAPATTPTDLKTTLSKPTTAASSLEKINALVSAGKSDWQTGQTIGTGSDAYQMQYKIILNTQGQYILVGRRIDMNGNFIQGSEAAYDPAKNDWGDVPSAAAPGIYVKGDSIITVSEGNQLEIKKFADAGYASVTIFNEDSRQSATYYEKDGRVYQIDDGKLVELKEPALEEYKKLKNAQITKDQEVQKPGTSSKQLKNGDKIGQYTLTRAGDTGPWSVYFDANHNGKPDNEEIIGTYDEKSKLVHLTSIRNEAYKEKYLNPQSNVLYDMKDGKQVKIGELRLADNGYHQVTDTKGDKTTYDSEGRKIDQKDLILYQNGAFSYTNSNGDTVMRSPTGAELGKVKPDGMGGWFDDKGSHFLGDGTVLTQKDGKWVYSADSNQDGSIDGGASTEYKDCQSSTLGLVCQKTDGTIIRCQTNKECLDGTRTLTEEEEKELGNFMWLSVGNRIGYWEQVTSGYSGVSLLYDEPDPILEINGVVSDLLGGIDGWTSLICMHKATDSMENGAAYSSMPGGAYAHVEGQKVTTFTNNEQAVRKIYFYKFSFQVYGGSEDSGCDIEFTVKLKNSVNKYLFRKSSSSEAYVFKAKKDEDPISYAGPAMIVAQSSHDYDQICIEFKEMDPKTVYIDGKGQNCLIGIEDNDELCADIEPAGTTTIDLDNPCENGLNYLFIPNCWGSTQGSGDGGTQQNGDDAEPEDPEQTDDSPVIDI